MAPKTTTKATAKDAATDTAKAPEEGKQTAPADSATPPETGAKTARGAAAPGDAFDTAAGLVLATTDDLAAARKLWDDLNCAAMPAGLAAAALDTALRDGAHLAARLIDKAAAVPGDEVVNLLALRLKRAAFQANAASKMQGHATHILRLHAAILADAQG